MVPGSRQLFPFKARKPALEADEAWVLGMSEKHPDGLIKNAKINAAMEFLATTLQGKETALRRALLCFFAGGHLLIEDLPGLGKTTLALAIARTLGLSFGRVQCTSDLLPSDVTGLSLYNKNAGAFEFHPGPVFNNILLVDEINRATPKTQSALLEAMEENQATVEGKTYDLPAPFFVIATQNPLEHFGTFPLPESQLDRFMMKINIGYPSRHAEKEILKNGSKRKDLHTVEPLLTKEEVLVIQRQIWEGVYLSDKVLDYVLDVVDATRGSKYLAAGLSTRGSLAIISTAKTDAFFAGRDFVVPENIKHVISSVTAHRVLFKDEYDSLDREEIIRTILEEVPVPA